MATSDTKMTTDLELAEEIERHLAPDAIYWHWEPSMADMEQIIAALRRGPDLQALILRCRNCGSTNVEDAERPPSGEMVMDALERSVYLQSHYAELLNMHDGGKRMLFEDAAAWLKRLAEVSAAEAEGRKS